MSPEGSYRALDGSWRPIPTSPASRRLKFEGWCVGHRLRWLARLSAWQEDRRR